MKCSTALIVLLLAVMWTGAFAQTMVGGRVTDPQGGAVGGATIIVSAAEGGTPQTATTAADGTYSIRTAPSRGARYRPGTIACRTCDTSW